MLEFCKIQANGFSINRDEVEKVIAIPLSFFAETLPSLSSVPLKPQFPEDFPFHLIYGGRNYNWRTAAMNEWFYDYSGNIIWGITARIINNFKLIIGL